MSSDPVNNNNTGRIYNNYNKSVFISPDIEYYPIPGKKVYTPYCIFNLLRCLPFSKSYQVHPTIQRDTAICMFSLISQ